MKRATAGNFKHRQWKAPVTFYPSQFRMEGWEQRVKEDVERQAAKLAARLIDLANSGHDFRKIELSLFAVVGESSPVPEEELATA